LTVASGKKRAVLARHVRNRRLYDAIDQWAFCALNSSPGARTLYDQHRAAGDTHHQSPTRPGQPPRRHPARMPTPPHRLRRTQSLGTPPNHSQQPSRLTTYEPGMSRRSTSSSCSSTRRGMRRIKFKLLRRARIKPDFLAAHCTSGWTSRSDSQGFIRQSLADGCGAAGCPPPRHTPEGLPCGSPPADPASGSWKLTHCLGVMC
jgi:hypothetical protein